MDDAPRSETDPSTVEAGAAATPGRAGVVGLLRMLAIDFSPLRTSRVWPLYVLAAGAAGAALLAWWMPELRRYRSQYGGEPQPS